MNRYKTTTDSHTDASAGALDSHTNSSAGALDLNAWISRLNETARGDKRAGISEGQTQKVSKRTGFYVIRIVRKKPSSWSE